MHKRQHNKHRVGVRHYRHSGKTRKGRQVLNYSPFKYKGDNKNTRRRTNLTEPINPEVPGFGIALKTLIKGVDAIKKGNIKDSLRFQTTALAAFLALYGSSARPAGIDRRFAPIPKRTYDPHVVWGADPEDVVKWGADKSFKQSLDSRRRRRVRHAMDEKERRREIKEKETLKKIEKKKTLRNKLKKRNVASKS